MRWFWSPYGMFGKPGRDQVRRPRADVAVAKAKFETRGGTGWRGAQMTTPP